MIGFIKEIMNEIRTLIITEGVQTNNQKEVYKLIQSYYPINNIYSSYILKRDLNKEMWAIHGIFISEDGETCLTLEDWSLNKETLKLNTSKIVEIIKKEERDIKAALEEYILRQTRLLDEILIVKNAELERDEAKRIKDKFIDE